MLCYNNIVLISYLFFDKMYIQNLK